MTSFGTSNGARESQGWLNKAVVRFPLLAWSARRIARVGDTSPDASAWRRWCGRCGCQQSLGAKREKNGEFQENANRSLAKPHRGSQRPQHSEKYDQARHGFAETLQRCAQCSLCDDYQMSRVGWRDVAAIGGQATRRLQDHESKAVTNVSKLGRFARDGRSPKQVANEKGLSIRRLCSRHPTFSRSVPAYIASMCQADPEHRIYLRDCMVTLIRVSPSLSLISRSIFERCIRWSDD